MSSINDIISVDVTTPQGIQNVIVGTAASGYSGYSGFSGFSGNPAANSGYSGYSGRSGFSSISGYSGFSGFSGYSGFSGTPGAAVASGYSGYCGISGYSGFCGHSGYSGYSAASPGASGYSGFCGPSGYSGFCGSGYSGFCGQGFSGYSGYCGLSGYSGFSAASPGASGFSGYSGFCGLSGYSGFCGLSGYSGFSAASPGASGYSGYSGRISPLNADAPNSTIAINVLSGAPANLVSKSITYSAGDQVMIKLCGMILNNSTAARTYTFVFNLGSLSVSGTIGSTTFPTSATNRGVVWLEAVFGVKNTSSAWVNGAWFGTTGLALGTAGVISVTIDGLVAQQSSSDFTGTQTTSVQIYSSSNTATQSFELNAWSIEKYATNP